jgi:hypothetical protein
MFLDGPILIQENYDLNNSDDESDSDSDLSESDSSTSRKTTKYEVPNKVRLDFRQVAIKGPLASLFYARRYLTKAVYVLLLHHTKEICKLKESKVKGPIKFILGMTL